MNAPFASRSRAPLAPLLLLALPGLVTCTPPPRATVPPAEPPRVQASAPVASLGLPGTPVRLAALQPTHLPVVSWALEQQPPEKVLQVATEVPASLTASDGTGLRMLALHASAAVEDPLAFTELHLVFENPHDRTIEGRFQITLPPGATVSRFAMRQGDIFREGEVVELQAARRAYEDFLHRRQDPALLEKQAGNLFQARVFPIAPRERKELILSFSQELRRADEPYRLHLRGLPELDELFVRVITARSSVAAPAAAASSLGGQLVERQALEVRRERYRPDRDLVVPLAQAARLPGGLRYEQLAVARVVPVPLGTATDPDEPAAQGTVLLLDTSASRAPGFEARLARLADLLGQLAQGDRKRPLVLVAFDQEAETLYRGPIGDLGPAVWKKLRERAALGASDLGLALTQAARESSRLRGPKRVLLVTDGISTAGETDAGKLQQQVAALQKAGVGRLDALVEGGIRDEVSLRRLVLGGLPRNGIVIDGDAPREEILGRLRRAVLQGTKLAVEGASWTWPASADLLQPGDPVLVYADLPAGQPLRLAVTRASGARTEQVVPTRMATRPLLERAWINARMQRIEAMRLAVTDADLREAMRKQIIELSTRHRVLTDHTALLVLESEEDYARFHIDRRALVDILAMGPDGVVLLDRRQQPVLQLAAPVPPPPPAKPALAVDRDGFKDSNQREGAKLSVRSQRARSNLNGGAAPPRKALEAPPPPPAPSREEATGGAPEAKEAARPATGAVAPAATAAPEPPPAERSPEPKAEPVVRAGEAAVIPRPQAAPSAPPPPPPPPPPPRAAHRVIVTERQIQINERVYFEPGDARVRPGAEGLLREVAQVIRQHSRLGIVEVAGHASRAEASGQRLSLQRAQAVRAALIRLGVEARRLRTRGYGIRAPIGSEATDDGREKNRRVDFHLRGQAPGRGGLALAVNEPASKPPYVGRFGEVMALLRTRPREALAQAWAWRHKDPADVLALIALGEALEATGQLRAAARAYGSLIDLFPGRADLRRYAGARLERLGAAGFALAADTYRQAHLQRPDHPSSHRLLAYALVRAGQPDEAFKVIAQATRRTFPSDRFPGVERILREDAGLLAAAWIRRAPQSRAEILGRLAEVGGRLPTAPSMRFILNWETDANDVDFHINDGRGGHAYYSSKVLPSGGELYADITRGYGPECFTIEGRPAAYPYRLRAHYYSRGPMGYGMGKLEVLEHDGRGGLRHEQRPFIVMVDGAYVDLGVVKGPLRGR